MALAGITTVGEFHYLHHGRGGSPTTTRTRWATRSSRPRPRRVSGSRCSTRATCTAGSARPPNEVQRRFCDGDAEGWAVRASAVGSSATVVTGGAAPLRPCRRAGRWGPSWRVGRRAGRAAARPRQRAAGRERGLRRRLRPDAGRGPGRRPAWSAGGSPRSTPPTSPPPTSRPSALPHHVCFCPTTERDLADGIAPARRLSRAGAGCASVRLARRDRPVRGGASGGAR